MSISAALVLTAVLTTGILITFAIIGNKSPRHWWSDEDRLAFDRIRKLTPLLFVASILFWLGAIWSGVSL